MGKLFLHQKLNLISLHSQDLSRIPQPSVPKMFEKNVFVSYKLYLYITVSNFMASNFCWFLKSLLAKRFGFVWDWCNYPTMKPNPVSKLQVRIVQDCLARGFNQASTFNSCNLSVQTWQHSQRIHCNRVGSWLMNMVCWAFSLEASTATSGKDQWAPGKSHLHLYPYFSFHRGQSILKTVLGNKASRILLSIVFSFNLLSSKSHQAHVWVSQRRCFETISKEVLGRTWA